MQCTKQTQFPYCSLKLWHSNNLLAFPSEPFANSIMTNNTEAFQLHASHLSSLFHYV